MDCKHCKKRKECTKICREVEQELRKVGHSLKSHYKVLFFKPSTLDIIANVRKVEYKDIIGDNPRYDKHRQGLTVLIKKLTKRQQQCTINYYGLTTGEPMTQEAVATKLKLHKSTVHEHLKKAVAKLRKLFKEQ